MSMGQWVNLGIRADDTSGRAWVCTPRRLADDQIYLFSGTTNGTSHLQIWDSVAEHWRMVKRGRAGREELAFSDPGATVPAGTDNGHAVWDAVADELWVNVVNPWRTQLGNPTVPAIYMPATNSWRPVTLAEFPSYDFEGSGGSQTLDRIFNAGVASNPRWMVLYGGSKLGASSHLWTFDGLNRRWRKWVNHGDGVGRPGRMTNIQAQLEWIPILGRFLLYHAQAVWTLAPDSWTWTAALTRGSPPPQSQGTGAKLLGDRYVAVFGGSAITVLDLETWQWSPVRLDGSAPARSNAVFWSAFGHLYQAWGTGLPYPADREIWVFRDILAHLEVPRSLAVPLTLEARFSYD